MILGHENQIKIFKERFTSSSFHHAWLLKGPRGVGKFAASIHFAKEILKNSQFGGSFVDSHTHPNLKIIHREADKSISVEHVRNSLDFLTQTTIEGGWKVIIIDSIGELNTHSQNALLKSLEEPRHKTLFLLVFHDGEKILPTIRSRTISLVFNRLKKDHILQYIKENHPSLSSPHSYAELASGSIGRLNSLIKNDGLMLYQTITDCLMSNRKSALGELTLKYDPIFLGELITLIYRRCMLSQISPSPELIYEGEHKDLETIMTNLDWRKIGNLFTQLYAYKALHLEASTLFIE